MTQLYEMNVSLSTKNEMNVFFCDLKSVCSVLILWVSQFALRYQYKKRFDLIQKSHLTQSHN